MRLQFHENELKIYARLIWRWLWLIILCTLLGGIAAFIGSRLSTPIYQASTTLLINEARNPATANYQDILASERVSRTYAELLTQRPVLDEVADLLGLEPTIFDQDISDIRVTPVRDTQLIRIEVEGTSPQLVAAIANTLPQVFIAHVQEIQSGRYASSKQNLQTQLLSLDAEIQTAEAAVEEIGVPQTAQEKAELDRLQDLLVQYKNSYATVLGSYEELRLVEAQSVDSITITEPGEEPDLPIRPRTLMNTLLAAIVGAMLALGAIFLIEYLDDRIRSPEELTRVLDTAWMGAIARIPHAKQEEWTPEHLITANEPRHPISEAFRRVRTNLQFSRVDTGLRSLLVTSANPGEGKSMNAANLAVVMAQAGLSVVLVDADLRRPVQHKMFAAAASPGLTEALLQREDDPGRFLWQTEIPNLRLLTCGKRAPNPAELLGSQRMHQLLLQLQAVADVVIVDAPPVLAVTDAQVLGRQVEGVLLVVDAEKTTRSAAARAVEALRQVGVDLLGAVVNRLSRSSQGYYYYDYSHYYADSDDSDRRNGSRPSRTSRTPSARVPVLPEKPVGS